MINKTSMGRP